MRRSGLHLLIVVTYAAGGGSLLLFTYFLLFGTPFTFEIAHSAPARLAWDTLLCFVFFLQHSGMIRRGFKELMARRLPAIYYPALYSIASGAALTILVVLWQPTDDFLFRLQGPARWVSIVACLVAVAGFAWGARSLRPFDPFGTIALRAHVRGVSPPPAEFVARGPYRHVRHPLYLFMLLLIWSTPRLSTDQLLFDALWTAWIVVGTKLEERDLLTDFGPTYRKYQRSVPMLIPWLRLHRRET